ncbi:pyridoxamine 5'-phosphate oxidase [Asinibacterium sp. OR53]|jgi:pyridoxamine 5'-phosphate oxidase|uniref:pyridoxamine 5'-phosphate oxidase n=1 Tax=Asinibacterium sp. OR53 TaxID=925409 RepID=UPI00040DD129|nr:pyridoxamine 5'-phosphate oxidase [Asinibacterium sp. OR53]MBN8720197.1 pyridoxamine 5'-phosphate oxidase [Sediminibacterium magnilacihabitans]PQV59860.1 pyridoxamine 5'-phosphate oxidase [Sediminibacterium magnilacihabitans]
MAASSIADIRRDYKLQSLDENDIAADPITQFTRWWEEAIASHIDEVNAMTLATVTPEGLPAARIVLLKGYDEQGFVFFTNYKSRKGMELEANPHAALVFFWKELERQVRIEGTVSKTSTAESDDYFESRPAGSRIGAWASPQSRVVANRTEIETNYSKYEQQFGYENIPRPENWGGYIVKPSVIEFWQGRGSRLHDRLRYTASGAHKWKRERLAP